MSIELVGLAYDRALVDRLWSQVSLRSVFDVILEDDFRRKVDLRSMLYHKGQWELIGELEQMLRYGSDHFTLVELLAARFSAGVEEFPSKSGELAFDFQLIRHFASLAMVEDFLVAEPFLRELLRRSGYLKNGSSWSLLESRDFDGVVSALRELRIQDIQETRTRLEIPELELLGENLIRNYVEFLSYTRNNRLTPFFYNSETEFRKWGDLAERKNTRNETVVDLSMKQRELGRAAEPPAKATKPKPLDLQARMKLRRESDALVEGLRDADPLIRQKTAESLCRLAEPSTLPALIRALHDDEPEVRQEIVRAIGQFDSGSATEALLAVVQQDEVLSVRLTAAYCLRRHGNPIVIPVLFDAVEQGKPHFATLLAYHPEFRNYKGAAARLLSLMSHENKEVRKDAAFLWRFVPSKQSEAPLMKMLDDQDAEAAAIALYSLWSVAPSRAKEKANSFSKSADPIQIQAGGVVRHWVESLPTARAK